MQVHSDRLTEHSPALLLGEHQMELLDFVAAKFHEEGGVFKLLVHERKLSKYIIQYHL